MERVSKNAGCQRFLERGFARAILRLNRRLGQVEPQRVCFGVSRGQALAPVPIFVAVD